MMGWRCSRCRVVKHPSQFWPSDRHRCKVCRRFYDMKYKRALRARAVRQMALDLLR